MSCGARSRSAGSKVRTVPISSAVSGMTLWVVPLVNFVMLTTSASCAATMRLTTCWRFVTTCAPTAMGSTVSSGCAPCPPFPRIVSSSMSGAAMNAPGFTATTPAGSWLFRCRPVTTSTPSISGVCMTSSSAPPGPISSACWKIMRISPGTLSGVADSSCATPSRIAVCPSCPQACITPGSGRRTRRCSPRGWAARRCRPVAARCGPAGPLQDGQHAGCREPRDVQARHLPQLGLDVRGGGVLLEAHLGVHVQVPPPRHELRAEFLHPVLSCSHTSA